MNPKAALLALFAVSAAPVFAVPSSGHGGVQPHHRHVARVAHAAKAHPAEHYGSPAAAVRKAKRGAAKQRRCAAKTASISLASVSSTSVEAKKTTSTKKEEDKPTTTKDKPKPTEDSNDDKPAPTPKPTPKPDNNDDDDDDNSGGDGKTYTGDATFYSTGLNACGTYDKDSDMIAAVAWENFDNFPGANGNSNQNPICNKSVTATYKGKSVTVRITDRCAGCKYGALDFSPDAFDKLADRDLGRLHGLTWHFN